MLRKALITWTMLAVLGTGCMHEAPLFDPKQDRENVVATIEERGEARTDGSLPPARCRTEPTRDARMVNTTLLVVGSAAVVVAIAGIWIGLDYAAHRAHTTQDAL